MNEYELLHGCTMELLPRTDSRRLKVGIEVIKSPTRITMMKPRVKIWGGGIVYFCPQSTVNTLEKYPFVYHFFCSASRWFYIIWIGPGFSRLNLSK